MLLLGVESAERTARVEIHFIFSMRYHLHYVEDSWAFFPSVDVDVFWDARYDIL